MKTLLLISIFSIIVGAKSDRLRWREILLIAAGIGALVFWQTFNILFRYIGVE
jgi:hypothetical protein